jgi:hypothetical protein
MSRYKKYYFAPLTWCRIIAATGVARLGQWAALMRGGEM